jgi:DNA-binding response OmpR family regulator
MRVLVVDDRGTTQDALAAYLEAEGFEADHAGNGEGALSRMEVSPPDAVVTDLLMPGLDGLGLLRRMRADARWASIPVVVLTAAGDDVLARLEGELPPLHPYRVLRKPQNPAALAAVLRELEGVGGSPHARAGGRGQRDDPGLPA